MKKNNIIIIFILIFVVSFALGFSVNSAKNINQNVNTIKVEHPNKKVNLNTADKAELMSIEGIGEKKSQLIIDNRPYKSIWDLVNIKGISENYVNQIKDKITID